MRLRKPLLAFAFLCTALPSWAGPATDSLVTCVGDSTNGRDRKLLMRWLFSAVAAHPDMSDISTVSPASREESDKAAALIFTRLLAENCAPEVRNATKFDGPEAVGKAFESLGRLAMQEMSASPEVRTSMTGFYKFVDRKKLEAAMRGD